MFPSVCGKTGSFFYRFCVRVSKALNFMKKGFFHVLYLYVVKAKVKDILASLSLAGSKTIGFNHHTSEKFPKNIVGFWSEAPC